MSEEAERDLRIAKEFDPNRVMPFRTVQPTDRQHYMWHTKWTAEDGETTICCPDYNDSRNLEVIVEAKGISVEYLDYRKQWLAYSHTIRKEKEIAGEPWSFSATGPTPKAAILALLDPGKDGRE